MKIVADRKVCFEAAKKASNYREFRSMLKNKGCTMQILKEAWAAKDEATTNVVFMTPKTPTPRKSIKKAPLKKKVTIRNSPPAQREYEKYLSPVSGKPDKKHIARHAVVHKQQHKIEIDVDFLPEINGKKLGVAQKKTFVLDHDKEIREAIKDLLFGYDISTLKLERGDEKIYSAKIKANKDWIGNETTIIKSVKAVFENPNSFIEDGAKCAIGDQTLKLRLKSIKKA